jgi:hypothetical protein
VAADNPGASIGVDPPNSSMAGSASDHAVAVSLDMVQPIPVPVWFPPNVSTPAFMPLPTSSTADALSEPYVLGPSIVGLSLPATTSTPESSDLVPRSSSVWRMQDPCSLVQLLYIFSLLLHCHLPTRRPCLDIKARLILRTILSSLRSCFRG